MKSTIPSLLINAAKNAGLAGLVLACGLVATGEWKSVEAYVTTGTHYTTPTASYYVNAGFPDASAGNAAAQIAAIRAGADTWHNQAQVPFSFVYAGTTAVNTVAFDGVNTIFYSPTDGGGALAVCYWWTSGGSTQQFDIEFFDRAGTYDFIWATNPTSTQFDIQSVAAHEFGHALGLNHSTVTTATMYPSVAPGDIGNRTLDTDDVSGARSLYGIATPTVGSCSPSHGFALGGNTVSIFGTNFTPGVTSVTFDGRAASGVSYVSATQLSCTVPSALQNGTVSVAVTCNGASASAPVYSYDLLRINSTPVHGGVSILEVQAPTDAGRAYQIVASLGNTGIPLSLYLNPADTRILPGVFDELFVYSVQTPNAYFGNFHSVLDQTGHASAQFFVPSSLLAVGKTVTFSVVTFNTQALSGLQQIGNGVTVTIQ